MIKKDFKQKYFLYCRDCEIEEIIAKKVKLEQKPREKIIKIIQV